MRFPLLFMSNRLYCYLVRWNVLKVNNGHFAYDAKYEVQIVY